MTEEAKEMVGMVGEAEVPLANVTRTVYVKGWCGDNKIMVTTQSTNKAWEMNADDLRNTRDPQL